MQQFSSDAGETFRKRLVATAKGSHGAKDMSREQAREALAFLMSAEAHPAQIGAFLTAMRFKGARVEELRASGIFQYNYFVSPHLLEGKNKITVRWAETSAMMGRAVRVTWAWKEKAGKKEDVHTAKRSGGSYGISVGDVPVPNGGALDPTFIDRLEAEVVPSD